MEEFLSEVSQLRVRENGEGSEMKTRSRGKPRSGNEAGSGKKPEDVKTTFNRAMDSTDRASTEMPPSASVSPSELSDAQRQALKEFLDAAEVAHAANKAKKGVPPKEKFREDLETEILGSRIIVI
jgi:hypothetical protein